MLDTAINRSIIYKIPVFIFHNYKVKICLSHTKKPVWGNLDILKACGALDSGSNPGAGVNLNCTKFCIVNYFNDPNINNASFY